MKLFDWLKGVWNSMFKPSTIQEVLKVTPAISEDMKEKIELWEQMYKGEAPWLDDKIKSLGLPAMIASEKARMATLEMQVKITGDSERAKYIEGPFLDLVHRIRKELEYGIALGGFVVKPFVSEGPDGYKIETSFVTANEFYPLSFSVTGEITEAAFIDRIITKDYIYSKVERQKLENNVLTVENYAFKKPANNHTYMNDSELGDSISLQAVPDWEMLIPHVELENMDTLLFAYFRMPQANNVDMSSPLGVSGFSRAEKLIEDADTQYSNLLWEFEGGQLAIDVDRTAFDIKGDPSRPDLYVLPKLQDRLYRRTLDLGQDEAYHVFAPKLRDDSLLNGLNSILIQIENVTDLSRGTLSAVEYKEARTATELKIIKQRSYSANSDIQKELEKTLEKSRGVMDKLCDMYEIVPAGDYQVSYCWDDSIIIDKDAERQVDLIDVEKGLMSKQEYRIKWYGETEEQAVDALKVVEEEKQAEMDMQLDFIQKQQAGQEQANQTQLQRASESNKVTKMGKENV